MKKEFYIPLIIVALTLVFVIICLMVYLSDGNAYWIKKKLKIGALLLMFNGIVYGTNGQAAFTSCYLGPGIIEKPSSYGITVGKSSVLLKNPQVNTNNELAKVTLPEAEGTGWSIGLGYEYTFGIPHRSLSSLICNLRYNSESSSTKQNSQEFTFVDDGVLIKKFSRIEVSYNFSSISTEIFYNQKFYKRIPLGIILGPYFLYRIQMKANETLYEPIGPPFIQSIIEIKTTLFNDEIINANNLDMGIKTGLQYEIYPIEELRIIPYFTYTYSLINLKKNSDWKMTSLDFGISIRYRF